MRGQLLLAFAPIAIMAQIQPVRAVTSVVQRIGHQAVPGFQNGYLYFVDQPATVRAFSPEGFPALTTVVQIPNVHNTWVHGLAVDKDGAFAVGVAYENPALGGGIAFYNKYGQSDGFIATGSYLPESLCFADDHSVWAFGGQRGSGDYMMVHHYTTERREAGQFLARSLFPKGLDPGMGLWQTRNIVVTRDRVGLLAFSGVYGNLNEWVELDLSGRLIRRIRLDQREFTPMAFTEDGHLYRKRNYKSALQVLSRTTSDWHDVGMSALGSLLGADGNLLVFSPSVAGPVTMQWFDQPATFETLPTVQAQFKSRANAR